MSLNDLCSQFRCRELFEVKMECIRCGYCCTETEMELLPVDIESIRALGYDLDDFAVFDGEMWRLKNVDGHCVFFDPNTTSCRIYEHRPIGCRIYPLQLDLEQDRVVVDEMCPMAHTIPSSELERLERYVRLFLLCAQLTDEWIKLVVRG